MGARAGQGEEIDEASRGSCFCARFLIVEHREGVRVHRARSEHSGRHGGGGRAAGLHSRGHSAAARGGHHCRDGDG